MYDLSDTYRSGFSHLFGDKSPHPDAFKIMNKVKVLQPGLLADIMRFKIFRALLEWEYENLYNNNQYEYRKFFGFISAVKSGEFIERISKNMNVSTLVAVRILSQYMGIYPENVFSTFPVSKNSLDMCHSIPKKHFPETLNVGNECYSLSHIEYQNDFSGYAEQAICFYRNESGSSFHIMAVREMIMEGNRKKPYLKVGRVQASSYLLGRTEIDRNDDLTVVLPLDFEVAIELRKLSGSDQICSEKFIISGIRGNTEALQDAELSPLLHHRVILIPEFHREAFINVDKAIKRCLNAGASNVSIFPWPLFTKEPEHATSAWKEEFQKHGVRLDTLENISWLLKKMSCEALSLSDFKTLLSKQGVIIQQEKQAASSDIVFKTLKDLKQVEGSSPHFSPDFAQLFTVGQITLLWGPSNSGKSLVALTFAFALASGTSAFLIENSSEPRRVLLIDGELPETDLQTRIGQITAEHTELVEKNLLFFSMRESPTKYCNITSIKFTENLCNKVRQDGINVVIIDNLITLAPDATRGNDDALFAFIRSIEQSGASVILVHHSTKSGDTFRGTANFASKSQNIIQVEGRDSLMADEKLKAEFKDALASTGAVVRLTWQKCKHSPMLEGQSFDFQLPLGGTWKSISDETAQVSSIPEVSEGEEKNAEPDALSHNESQVMKLFSGNQNRIRRKDVEKCLGYGQDKAGAILNSLKGKKMIQAVGGGRSTAYIKV